MMALDGLLGPLDAEGRVAPAKQTRLASFLITAHQANAQLLQGVELIPFETAWHGVFHSQLWREIELVQLLLRVTRWVPDLALAAEAATWQSFWWRQQIEIGATAMRDGAERSAVAATALGHALHSIVRLTPLLPQGAAQDDPFNAALVGADLEAGRMIQAQIRFLKELPFGLDRTEIERLVAEKRDAVSDLWQGFVATL
jgi:hypothetical protein